MIRTGCAAFAAMFALVALTPGSAPVAKPVTTTKYTYYNIKGTSAQQLYSQMLRHGPTVGGRRAFAATTALTQHSGELRGKQHCSVEKYKIKVDFTIKLPKVIGTKPKGNVRGKWSAFVAFVKKHELRHRSIWIGCAHEVERRIRAIKASDCAVADKKAAQIYSQVQASCTRQHDAFDAAERKRLSQHPLIVAASRSGARAKVALHSSRNKTTGRKFTRAARDN